MKYAIDVAYKSMNKYGEELSGDFVKYVKLEDSVIVVLADGLGSGVKANILATLTATIAATMLKEGASLEETIDTIVQTLPECSIRKLAYSTFTIIKVKDDGSVYIAEFDNPNFFLFEHGKTRNVVKQKSIINHKTIYETQFRLHSNDLLTVVSDGVIHAGVGRFLNHGWQWEHVNNFLQSLSMNEKSASSVVNHLIGVCQNLYDCKPGDDTTVVAIKVRVPEVMNLFTGPPARPEDDKVLMQYLKASQGKIVISGGTTANIVARELNRPLEVDLDSYSKEVPPMAKLEGITLITEGVLTLNRTIELIQWYLDPLSHEDIFEKLQENNGAARLAKMIIEDCTELNIYLGKAVNPAHQNPNFPINFNIKVTQINQLVSLTKQLGKEVKLITL